MHKAARKGACVYKVGAMDQWFEEVARCVTEGDNAEQLEQLSLVQQQVDLLVQYHATCAKLQAFSEELRERGESLVPFRFPLRPTPRNRTSIEEGMARSFGRFVEDLHVMCLTTNSRQLECLRHVGNSPFVANMVRTLTSASCRVLDRELVERDARSLCEQSVERSRVALIRAERQALVEVSRACTLVAELMTIFCRRWSARKRSASRADTVVLGRAFLKTAARQGQGLSHAVHTLCKRRRMATVFEGHAWMSKQYADLSDEEVIDMCERLVASHALIERAVRWEVRRIEWLSAANAANACWGGVTVASESATADDTGFADGAPSPSETWATDGAVIHAPAHMGAFAKLERLRLVAEPQTAQFTSFLGTVRVANVLLDLLNTKQLALGRISAEYAQRIVAFDFSKYETASQRIVEETLRPFGESVGVNFFDD